MRIWLMVAAALTPPLVVGPRIAIAAPFHVTMLRSPNAGPLVRELTARAAGELVAAGFSVDVVDLPSAEAGGDATTASSATAAMTIRPADHDAGDALMAISVGSRQIYRAIVTRADVDVADGGRVLAAAAVHAVAALQAALVATVPRASASAGPETPAVTAVPQPRSPRLDAWRGLGAGVGLSLLQSLQGVAPTLSPLIRLSY